MVIFSRKTKRFSSRIMNLFVLASLFVLHSCATYHALDLFLALDYKTFKLTHGVHQPNMETFLLNYRTLQMAVPQLNPTSFFQRPTSLVFGLWLLLRGAPDPFPGSPHSVRPSLLGWLLIAGQCSSPRTVAFHGVSPLLNFQTWPFPRTAAFSCSFHSCSFRFVTFYIVSPFFFSFCARSRSSSPRYLRILGSYLGVWEIQSPLKGLYNWQRRIIRFLCRGNSSDSFHMRGNIEVSGDIQKTALYSIGSG